MATSQKASDYGITFSRGAQATAEGVSNAAKQGIVNNVQTSGGKAVKGSTKNGRDVSGQSAASLADPNEVANVTKEAADFNKFMGANPQNKAFAGPTAATPAAIDTSTPYTSGSFSLKNPNDPTVYNDRNEALTHDQYLQQGGKADFSNVQKAYESAVASGVPAPQDGGEARSMMGQFSPPTAATPPPAVDNFLQTNPMVQNSMQELVDFLSPENTRKELEASMKQIITDKKTAAKLNMELMDVKRVMEGTDQDIRDEVEKVGGFATESQVQALTIGRNKTLLKKASMIQDKLNYMQDVINTDMMMYGFQKDAAQQEFQQRSFLLQYKQQNDQFIYNATQNAINRNLQLMGADGMYDATQGDPVKIGRLERAMGLEPGGLKVAADMAAHAKAKEEAQQAFENSLALKQVNISAGNLALSREKLQYDKDKDALAALQLSPEEMGKLQSSNEYKTISGLLPAIQSIAKYRGLISKYGTGGLKFFQEGQRGELDSAYGNAIVAWKSLAALGALSGADFKLAENAIPETGLFKSNTKSLTQLNTSLDNAVEQAKTLTTRLQQTNPKASSLLEQQLDEILIQAYPNKYTQAPDGRVIEITN